MDGNTGDELWRHYSNAEIFAVNCEEDIDKDGVKDCLGAGRAGVSKTGLHVNAIQTGRYRLFMTKSCSIHFDLLGARANVETIMCALNSYIATQIGNDIKQFL